MGPDLVEIHSFTADSLPALLALQHSLAPARRHESLATLLLKNILTQAAKEGCPRVSNTVSSRNEGSIRLHRRLKIPEVERRTVWQKDLG